MTERYSFGHKAISVALSVVLLGFGWPTTSLTKAYGTDAAVSDAAAQVDAQDGTGSATGTTADNSEETSATTGTTGATQSEEAATKAASDQGDSSDSADAEADIALKLNNGFIDCEGQQPLSAPATHVTVPTSKDFEFSAAAISGYVLDSVTLTVSGSKTTLTADADDVYTVPAASIKAGATITLNTSEDENSAANSESNKAVDITDADGDSADNSANNAAQSAVNSNNGISVASDSGNAVSNFAGTVTGNDTLEVGKFAVYTANGFSGAVTWSTSDSSKATVDNGVVTAVSAGSVTITAAYGNETASKTISVDETSSSSYSRGKSSGKTATITPTIENADVAYFAWHEASDTSNIAFTKVSGTVTINDYTTSSKPGYVVFLVKPNSNHIVTGLGASGNGDIYAVDATSWGNISSYPNMAKVMAAAKAAGYVATFGWCRGTNEGLDANFTISAKSPDMTVTAVSDRTEKVASGDELTFTVTITPKTTGSGKDSVSSVHVNSADVNGTSVQVENLTQNRDGTFTGTVHYTATDADCNRGKVVLTVNATSTYAGAYTISSGDLASTATVTKTATATCKIAPESDVQYEFVSGTSGMALPGAINTYLPVDNKKYGANKTVKALQPSQTVYEDSANDGYWTFDGWDDDSKRTDRTNSKVTFTGTWIFTKYSKYTIKYVDESGAKLLDPTTVSGNKVDVEIKVSDIEKPSITGYTYDKASPSSELKIKSDDSENVITLKYKKKAGKAGYNLVLGNATWSAPSDTTQESGAQKWYYNYGFAKGDTFVVTDSKPTAENHAFIGWFDKERDGQAAGIREAGQEVTYCYSKDQTYTLDALWANLSAMGEDVTYDGESHTVTVDVNINEGTGLDDKYVEQAKKLISTGDVEYSTDGGASWSTSKPSFKDAGTYTVKVRQAVTVGGQTTTLTAETQVKIAQKEYWVETNTASKTYDGTPLAGTATVRGLIEGESAKATATTIGPDVTASIENKVVGEIVWTDGTKASNYKRGTDQLGTLEITKRNITLTSGFGEKAYDGTALTNSNVTVSGDGFVDGEGATYKVTGSQTLPGSSENAFTYTLNFNTKAGNYDITTKNGTLKVTDREDSEKFEITVEGNSTTATYDGQQHTASGITTASSTFTNKAGAVFTITADTTSPESTNVTAADNKVSNVKVTDASGTDVTAQFKVTTKDGKLTINKKDATITAGSAEKEYDGKALTTDEFTTDGFVNGEGIASATIEGSQTVVGSTPSTVKANSWSAKEGTNLNNYNISTANGTLTVTDRTAKYQIALEGVTETKTYNGSDQTMSGVKSDTFEFNGETFQVKNYKSDVTGKDAGDYTQTITSTNADGHWTVVDAAGNDVSKQFSVTTKSGKLTISPKDVTITSGSASKTYDGSALTKAEASVTAGGFVNDEEAGVSYTYTGSQTNQGSSENKFEVVFDGESAKASNYNVTKVNGTLTVNAVADEVVVTIKGNTGTVTYNGAEQSVTGYTVQSIKIGDESTALYKKSDFAFSGTATAAGKNASKTAYAMGLKSEQFANTSKNFTNVKFVVEDGSLTINKRAVTLISATNSKTYDGTPLTDGNVTVSGDGFVSGEGATYIVTGTITDCGSVDNAFTYALNAGTNPDNYTIISETGTLSISPITDQVTVTIKGKTESAKYDGKLHAATGYDVVSIEGSELYTADLVECGAAATAERTDAGTTYMGLTEGRFSNKSKNFSNVKFVVTDGSVTVNQREVTLKSASDEKFYDGDPLTNGNVTVGGDGFAEGEGATYSVTGSRTLPGTSENAFTYELNSGTKAENYKITATPGSLTVKTRDAKYQITVEANSDTVTYDGKEHTVSGLKQTTFTENGKTYTVEGYTASATATDAGTYAVNVEGTPVVKDASGNVVTDQFEITPKAGALTIGKATVTLKSADLSKTYDGTALTNGDTKLATETGFAEGEGATYTFSGSQTDAGKSANTFSYALNANTKASNYNTITPQYGTLTVNPVNDKVTVTITENSDSKVFNNQEQSVEGYTVATNNWLYTESCFSFVGEASHKIAKGTNVGAYDMGLVAGDFENVSSNFTNVEFVIVDGKLTITPADIEADKVVWSTTDIQRKYDGSSVAAGTATAKDKFGRELHVQYSADEGKTWVDSPSDITATNYSDSKDIKLRATADYYAEGQYAESVEALTITKRMLSFASASASKKFDGTALTRNAQSDVTVTGDGFVGDEGATFDITGTQTEVGWSPNAFSYSFNKGTQPENYKVIGKTEGKLEVTDNDENVFLFFSGEQKTYVYDGQYHYNNDSDSADAKGWTYDEIEPADSDYAEYVSREGLTEDQQFSYTGDKNVSRKDVGTSPLNLDQNKFVNNLSQFTGVGFMVTADGWVKITAQSINPDDKDAYKGITVEAPVDVVYNGDEQHQKPVVKDANGNPLVEGKDYKLSYSADVTNVGTVTVTVTGTGNYTGTVNTSYQIKAREVTLESGSQIFDYDGTAHTLPNVTGWQQSGNVGFVAGEVTDVAATGSVTNVSEGEVTNSIAYTATDKFKASNYSITKNEGKLSVRANGAEVVVTITENSASYVYDGAEKTVSGYVISGISNDAYAAASVSFVGDAAHSTVSGTVAGFYPMGLVSGDFSNIDTNYSNVKFVIVDGGLTIAEQTIDPGTDPDNPDPAYKGVEVGSLSDVVYNGQSQQQRPTVKTKEGASLSEGTDYTVTFSEDTTNAGTVTVTVTGIGNYSGTVTRTYKIIERELVITTPGGSKVYDGAPLTKAGTWADCVTGYVEGESAAFETTGSQTEQGSSDNTYSINWNAEGNTAKAGNYKVVKETLGSLVVTKQSINPGPDPDNPDPAYKGVEVDSPINVTYDGQPHKWEPTVTDNEGKALVKGVDYEVGYSTGDFISAGTITVTITGAGNYTGSVTRTYTIAKRPVTLTSESKAFTYNGKAQSWNHYTCTDDLFASQVDGLGCSASVTNVGDTAVNTVNYTFKTDFSADNYDITTNFGTLSVKNSESEITVTTTGGTWTYDGKAHGATVSVSELPEGYTLAEAASSESETDVTPAGGVTVTADTLMIVNANGDDVTGSLKVTYVNGTIVINPAPLTVTTPDATKVYDGSALTAAGSYSGLVVGETIDFVTTGSQTEVGKSDNSYRIAWTGAKSSNYSVAETVGKLEVTKQSIDPGTDPTNPDPAYNGVQVGTLSDVVYNGQNQEQKPTVADKDGSSLVEGRDYKVTFSSDTKNAGMVTVTVEGVGNYQGTVTRTYNIKPRPVTIKSGNASKTYDGNPLTSPNADVTSSYSFVAGEVTDIRATGTITDYGSTENTISYTTHAAAGFLASNYDITLEPGTLTVTKASAEDGISLNTVGYSKMYDGEEVTLPHSDASTSVRGNAVTVEYSVNGVDWVTDPSGITAKNVADSKTVQVRASSPANYDGYVYGTAALEISVRNVTLSSETASKVYDGTALERPEVTVGGDGFVSGEVSSVIATGSITNVGTVSNVITYTKAASFVDGNYVIETSVGTLSITGQTIDPGTDPDNPDPAYKGVEVDSPINVTYDGQLHKWEPTVTDKEGTALVDGVDYEVGYSTGDFINVTGTITVTITGKGNFTGSVERTYQITPAPLSIETDPASKTYNGEPLTAGGKVVGLVSGETVTFATTGSQTVVGESDNTYSLKFDKTAKGSNYTIANESIGKLTVTESAGTIVVTTTGGTFTYNGIRHGAGVDVQGIPDGYTLDKAGSTATAKDVSDGVVAATADILVIRNAEGEDVTDKLNIKYVDGTIEVTPATLTVSTPDATKAYDGTPLTSEGSINGLVKNETVSFSTTGAQTLVGQSDNTYSLVWDGTAAKSNYTVVPAVGKLTVTDDINDDKVITKAHDSGTYDLGSQVAFTITAKNIYAEPKTMTISEIPGVALDRSVFENVQPGATVTATATYTVKESDILAGTFVNTATVSFSGSGKSFKATDEVDIAKKNAHLSVVKETASTPANGNSYALGEKISYKVTVTNDGNLTVRDVAVSDQLAGATLDEGQSAEVGTLAPGASATVRYVYTVTEADILAGKVVNSATASGKTDGGDPKVTPGDTEDKTDPANGSLSVEKTTTSTPENGKSYKLGETISYKIVVTNTGNLTVSGITVSDPNADNFTDRTIDALAPGAFAEFEAAHVVTEADIQAGTVVNVATAKGTDSSDKEIDNSGKDTDPTDTPNAALTVMKTAEQNGSAADGAFKLGETINYTITVTNTGNQTVSNVTVADPNADGFGEKTVDSLAPGESKTFDATHVVTQSDILAGSVVNTATATGTDPKGGSVDGDGEDTKVIDAVNTTLEVEKTASAPADGVSYKLGEEVSYQIVVTNKGNIDYTNVQVSDQKTGLSELIEKLAVGESKAFTTTHVVTEADIVAGSYVNTATAKGDSITDGSGGKHEVSGEDTETIGGNGSDKPIDTGKADLRVVKTVTNSGSGSNGAFALGDVIEYKITVTNDGNLTARNFQVVDNNADGFAPVTVDALAPGATTDAITAQHVVTSGDILAGKVVNVATVAGGSTDDDKVKPNPTPGETDSEVDNVDTTLVVEKVADAPTGSAYKLGDTVTYTVTVTNKGNVPYYNVLVSDVQTGLSKTIDKLAVGESKTFTTTHVVTESDIVAGSYKNVATAKADPVKDPKSGENVTPSGEGSETIGGSDSDKPIDSANPKLSITKTSDVAADHLLKEGETVNYTVTLTNSGNLTLTNIAVDDQLEGATLAEGESATIASLEPGAMATLHYSYTVKQSDVVAGFVANHVTATADNPSDKGTDVTPGDKTDPTEKAAPSLYISKTADKTADVTAGDVITYTIVATNNGNVDLTGVVVSDELTKFESDSFDLAKGESKTFTQTYTVTEADMVAGSVKNVATASATDPKGGHVDGKGETTSETEAIDGALSVMKTAAAGSYAAGDTVEYTITVTNTGNVTVSDIKVVDAKTGLDEMVTLAKGESKTYTTSYVVTDEDIKAGTLENVATAKGTDPAGKDVEASGSETIGNTPVPDPDNPDVPVLKREFSSSNPSDVVYNGSEQQQKPIVTDGDKVLVEGVDYELSYTDATNAGEVAVTITGKGNYTGTSEVTYQITKRPVTLTSASQTWTYDGNEHTATDVTCSDDVFAGQVEGLAATGSVTNVGDSATNVIAYRFKAGFTEDNFMVSKAEGTLGITAQAIDPGTDPDNPTPGYIGVTVGQLKDVVYNGVAQEQKPAVLDKDGNPLVENVDYIVSFGADTTNVGTVVATVTGIGNYAGKVERTYRITPATLSVTTASAEKVYDGTALTKADGWTLEGLVAGETATVKATGEQTAAGSSDNTYELAWGTAKASNYRIASEELGTLTVKAQEITPGPDPVNPDPDYSGAKVSDPSDSVYDGTAHKWSPTVTDGQGNVLVEGRDYTVDYATEDFTDAGTIVVTITGAGNYSGTVTKSYRITPATLNVATPSADKVYDGTPLTAEGTISGFVAGETADFETTGKQTAVGTSANSYEIAWTGTAKQSNYIVSESVGTLTVKESADEIIVTVTGGTYTYDGSTHAATVSVGTVPAGYTVETAETTASATDATVVPVKATLDKLVIRNASGEDVTSNLNVKVNEGSITINPAKLVVVTPDSDKVYDGTPLTAEGSISGFVAGETADFETTGKQTAVGTSANSYEISWTGTAKQSNYTISETVGTLTVTEYAGSIVATTTGGTFTYDGTAHGATVEVSGVPAGYTVDTAASTATATNVAQGAVAATADQLVIRNASGEDVTSKLDIVYVDGSIAITPATLYVTTGSATKVYDGQALTSTTLEINGLVGGDRVSAAATGAQIAVGSSENTYRITWGDVDSQNYRIVENLGTLTVTAAAVVPVNPGNSTNGTTPRGTTSLTPSTPAENATTSAIVTAPEYDNANSVDEPNEELIYDEETPLGSSEAKAHCWVHYLMFLGIFVTLLYGALVSIRRSNYTRGLKKDMNDILGGGDDGKDPEGSSVAPSPATMGA